VVNPEVNVAERVRALLEAGETEPLRELLIELPPEDIEELFEGFDNESRRQILSILDREVAAEVLGGVDEHVQEEMTDVLSERELAFLVEEMDSDEAADTLRHLEPAEQDRVLELLEDATESEVRELLQHEEDTAGDLMMVELAALPESALVAEAIEELRDKAEEIRELYNLYVVDRGRRLLGSISLRDLVLARPGMPLGAVMSPVTAVVTPEMDQEEVANIFRKYDLVSLPVVDDAGLLVGRITVDDVMDVIEEEAREDISRLAGVGEESFHSVGVLRVSRDRLPWLVLGLFGGLFSARILQGFEGSLAQVLELAFFVPVIMALAGNIGIQSSTIIVRALATGELRQGETGSRVRLELGVSVLNGLVIGLLTFLVIVVWLGQRNLGILVSASMISVVLWATLTGTLIPLILRRFGIDPAYASGPFITTTNDIVALTIYLVIAYRFRHLLV
jgi:magnesium transporter